MNEPIMKSFFLILLAVILPVVTAFGQQRDLDLEDYDQWQSITSTALSPDGSWFAFQVGLVDGDGWLSIKEVTGDTTYQFMYGSRPDFSTDNRWFAFAIGVPEEEAKKLEKEKKQVKMKMGLMNLLTAEVDTFQNVASFSFSEDGRYLAIKKYKAEEVKTRGADLVLQDLSTGVNQLIGNVAEHGFNEQGTRLAVLLDAYEKFGNGVHLYDLEAGITRVLDSDEVDYRNLTWDEEGTALAFLKSRENNAYEEDNHIVYAFQHLDTHLEKSVFDSEANEQFPGDFRVVHERSLRWSENGEIVFFGIKEWEKKEEEAEDDMEEEVEEAEESEESEDQDSEEKDEDLDPPAVDVWHWRDAVVQPQQKVRANQDRDFSYLSAWTPGTDSFVRLADEAIRNVTLTGDQHHGIGYDRTPYEPAFRETWNDVYVINAQTGEKQKILDRYENVAYSPDGTYILYFKENNWWTYHITEGQHANITETIPTRFNDFTAIFGRENDRAFGSGQWAHEDAWVLLYDQYDVYKVQPDGSSFERLTHGTDDHIRYRQVRLDYEEDYLDPDQPIYFNAYGDFTKDSGYYRLSPAGAIEQLIYESSGVDRLTKAEDSDLFIFRRQKADESPNFFRTDARFENTIQLTDTNPQQTEYFWGYTELVTYTNDHGEELQGRLLYPAHYEAGKQYPMVVYIYEKRSQSLHSYTLPSRTSPYNQRRLSAEGFFVFEPDIVYRLRDPGMSAVECVVPAVKEVLSSGDIDKTKVGLMGHSWGGYQTAFLITQTDIFSAAIAGAPLTNRISMYNSVYWNSGSPDAVIFEVSQGRFPDPYWEDWDKFVTNSPIFNIQNTKTPLLVEFGDNDGAVDFNQGVELYNTMRRMEKPYIMLVYEGENHGLAQKQNQIDYATRGNEWFRHFLLGEEPASWITDGVPYLEKPSELEKKENENE